MYNVAVTDSGFGRWEGGGEAQGVGGVHAHCSLEHCKLANQVRPCPIRLCNCGVSALKIS